MSLNSPGAFFVNGRTKRASTASHRALTEYYVPCFCLSYPALLLENHPFRTAGDLALQLVTTKRMSVRHVCMTGVHGGIATEALRCVLWLMLHPALFSARNRHKPAQWCDLETTVIRT